MSDFRVHVREKSLSELRQAADQAYEALLLATVSAMVEADTSDSAIREIKLASKELEHWQRQQAYSQIRALWPTAAALQVDLSQAGQCRILAAWETTGRSVSLADAAATDTLADATKSLRGSIYNTHPGDLPGWAADPTNPHRFRVRLAANPPALALDLGERDQSGRYPSPRGIAEVVRELCNGFLHSVRATLAEYARAMVEGWQEPVTSTAQWTAIAGAMGHPADPYTQLWIGNEQVTDEDWQSGISALHTLAAGVVWNYDTGEMRGEQDALHQRLVVNRDLLIKHGLTLDDLVGAFDHDVRLAAVSVLRALANDRFAGARIKN